MTKSRPTTILQIIPLPDHKRGYTRKYVNTLLNTNHRDTDEFWKWMRTRNKLYFFDGKQTVVYKNDFEMYYKGKIK